MAHDKLKESIEGFPKALKELEQFLAKRPSELGESTPYSATADRGDYDRLDLAGA
jgi:hypothetical protein